MHLGVGVTAGSIILVMSVTGVLLTYERQILRAIDDGQTVTMTGPRQAVDVLVAGVLDGQAAADSVTLRFSAVQSSPVRVSLGRSQQWLIDPYSARVMRAGPGRAEAFFRTVTGLHRWLAMSGDDRSIARAITGYSNLLFGFLLITGIYLWLPKFWLRSVLRDQVLLKRRYASGKARDYAWHHVFSFWAVLPLLVLIVTATVFYFPWSNNLVYAAYGEQSPQRRSQPDPANDSIQPGSFDRPSSQQAFARALSMAQTRGVDWTTLNMTIPVEPDSPWRFVFDPTIGGQPHKQTTLLLDAQKLTGTWSTFADNTAGRRARVVIRFLHTGEVLGIAGQTVAGLASLAGCLLVWSGLALAWRRLIRPLLR